MKQSETTVVSPSAERNLFVQILQTSAEGETTVVSLCFIYRTILYEISQCLYIGEIASKASGPLERIKD
ncbi:hypothetical protein BpHYR1_053451 [Brachionus plicatilis]|uniref:Uncharacterized protein n=1 Tax=Brachionus plicatilis TaxID=10195 RepID=A0A3M7PEU2_BRAPC|nr:hypothetical protein BpHYR1_053451 [Brachionus plicatilis]